MSADLETRLTEALRGPDAAAPVTAERAGENLRVTVTREGRAWQAWHSDLGGTHLLLVSIPRAQRDHLLSLGHVDALEILKRPLSSPDEVWEALKFAAHTWPRNLMLLRSLLSLALQEANDVDDVDEGADADLRSVHVSLNSPPWLTVSAWITAEGTVDWEADIDNDLRYLPADLDDLREGLRERGFWPTMQP